MRYIIRPKNIFTTPKILRKALNAERTVPYSADYLSNRWVPDWRRDLFLVYPPGALVGNATPEYRSVRNYCQNNKLEQRRILRESGIPIPFTRVGTNIDNNGPESPQRSVPDVPAFVVRPLRHARGESFRTTGNIDDYNPETEYIQELYPKTHEYRIIFVFGTPLITLYKRIPDGLGSDVPWNHANGTSFVTVNDWANNRLRHFDIYDRLKAMDVVKHAHIVAADVMYASKKNGCVVTELNFCPSITIPDNVQKVAQHVHQVLVKSA